MEPVPQSYVANQQILAAELNDLCARAVGARPANFTNQLTTGTVTPNGLSEVVWVMGGGANLVAAGDLRSVDSSIDWRDRVLFVQYAELTSGVSPGNASDYLFDVVPIARMGFTGTGALDAGSNIPTAGNPPVPAAGTSYALQITTNVWLYARPSTGVLTIYNGTGSNIIVPMLLVRGTAKTGHRP